MSRITKRSQRITLYEGQGIADLAGGQEITWHLLGEYWADVQPEPATLASLQGSSAYGRKLAVFVRSISGLQLPIQIIWKGKTLIVVSIRDAGFGQTELQCEEQLA